MFNRNSKPNCIQDYYIAAVSLSVLSLLLVGGTIVTLTEIYKLCV